MADTKLFNIKGTVKEYQSGTVTLEKELQTVIENNMNLFFGVTFLASEYRTTLVLTKITAQLSLNTNVP